MAKEPTTKAPAKPRRKRPARGTYHHGNLRRALMDAALKFVQEGGPDAFSMAEAARQAGVSSGAPYRHFPDRMALMRAVAAEGEELLGEAMDRAIDSAGNDPWSRLFAVGHAQLAFAREYPAHFRVSYSPEYRSTDEDAGWQGEVETNRSRLLGAPRSRDVAAVFAAQCAIYGLARMLVDGQLGDVEPEALDEGLRAVLGTLRGRS
jgi:AcrR family transcriptional regulator